MTSATTGLMTSVYCDRLRARELEPPRYCPQCRRRMVVQVTPAGWQARCSVHGGLSSR
jgi:hypothetical protein